jgi:adenosylcobyric acid synthase
MNPTKVTRQTTGRLTRTTLFNQPIPATPVTGYEIHIGNTTYDPKALHFATLADGTPDGCIASNNRIFATYLHGIFDDDPFRHTFITAARAFHHLTPACSFNNWKQLRESALNRLADTVRESLDLTQIFSWVGSSYPPREAHP